MFGELECLLIKSMSMHWELEYLFTNSMCIYREQKSVYIYIYISIKIFRLALHWECMDWEVSVHGEHLEDVWKGLGE